MLLRSPNGSPGGRRLHPGSPRATVMSVRALPHWHFGPSFRRNLMDKKNVEGKLDRLGGKIKEVGGVVTNDRDLEAEGKIDQVKGNVKEGLGNLREGIKNKLDDLDRDDTDRR